MRFFLRFLVILACLSPLSIWGYSVEEFLGAAYFPEVKVSPDGRHVALIVGMDDFKKDSTDMAIWRLDVSAKGEVTDRVRMTFERGNYSALRWSPDGRYLSFLSTRKPAEAPQLFVLDMKGGEPLLVTDPGKFKEGISAYDWLPDGSGIVFAVLPPLGEKEEKAVKELYGDALRFAGEKPGTGFWHLAVEGFEKKAADSLTTVEQSITELAVSPDGKWMAYLAGPPAKPAVFYDNFAQFEVFLLSVKGNKPPRQLTHNFIWEIFLQWARDGSALYASGEGEPDAKRGVNTQDRLYRISIEDGRMENLAPGFMGDFDPYYPYDQLPDGSLLSNAYASTRVNAYRVDPKSHKAELLSLPPGQVSHLSTSRNGHLITFVLVTDKSFPEVYLANGLRDLGRARRATDFNAKLTNMIHPEEETVRWANGEGDTIEGVLYWPPGKRGTKNLHLIVEVHGGPWLAWPEGVTVNCLGISDYMYYPALLASSGYLVLAPNYRGSFGRGDSFLHAIEGYSGSRPATDILKGVDFLIAQGWADSTSMGVKGYSYGGLLTNYMITRTNRFRVACSGAGIWNDLSYFGTADNFINNDVRNLGKAPWEDLQNYWQESAISGAGNIKTPTLITHGGADRRVPTSQGYELYRSLVRLGVPCEFLVFPGEDHWFQKPSHKMAKVKAEIAWLDHYLLGKPLPELK